MQPKPPALRGRPADPELQQQRKSQLIDAAYRLLGSKSYRSITIREIAEQAGLQSAMVKYYFGDKQGLFLALLERTSTAQLPRLQATLASDEPIRAFIQAALQFFAQHPPLIRLITDEVLASDSQLKQSFIDTAPKQLATLLPQLIAAQQAAGKLHQDLDPKWTAFSLISLILMPFIGTPVRQQAWNIADEALSSQEWANHIYRVFYQGARP